MKRYIMLENHPGDSRIKIEESGVCQTLSGRMGTGGGNTPLVLEVELDDETQVLFDRLPEFGRDVFRQPDERNL